MTGFPGTLVVTVSHTPVVMISLWLIGFLSFNSETKETRELREDPIYTCHNPDGECSGTDAGCADTHCLCLPISPAHVIELQRAAGAPCWQSCYHCSCLGTQQASVSHWKGPPWSSRENGGLQKSEADRAGLNKYIIYWSSVVHLVPPHPGQRACPGHGVANDG